MRMVTTPYRSSVEEGQILLARLDRLPVWPLPWTYLAIIGIGYFFTFYDISDVGLAMPAVATQFKLTGSESLFIAVATGLIGYIVGSIVIGGSPIGSVASRCC